MTTWSARRCHPTGRASPTRSAPGRRSGSGGWTCSISQRCARRRSRRRAPWTIRPSGSTTSTCCTASAAPSGAFAPTEAGSLAGSSRTPVRPRWFAGDRPAEEGAAGQGRAGRQGPLWPFPQRSTGNGSRRSPPACVLDPRMPGVFLRVCVLGRRRRRPPFPCRTSREGPLAGAQAPDRRRDAVAAVDADDGVVRPLLHAGAARDVDRAEAPGVVDDAVAGDVVVDPGCAKAQGVAAAEQEVVLHGHERRVAVSDEDRARGAVRPGRAGVDRVVADDRAPRLPVAL